MSAKREYFYGIKVQLIITDDGIPVEFAFLPGSASDTRAFDALAFDLPDGSSVYADSGYTDYVSEDVLKDALNIEFAPCRKKKSLRGDELHARVYKELKRKIIESVFSVIHQLLPKKIHATNLRGFLRKVFLFILAYTLQKITGKIGLAT